jgi:hypothetical protein
MMRGPQIYRLVFLLAAVLLGGCTRPVEPTVSNWPPLPPATKAVLLVTGSDSGSWWPPGCNHGAGGAGYRSALDAWIATQHPGVDRVWAATGDVIGTGLEGEMASLEFLGALARLPYDALGVGDRERRLYGYRQLVRLSRDQGFAFRAANFFNRDRMEAALPAEYWIESLAKPALVVFISPHDPEFLEPTEHGAVLTVDPGDAIRERVREANASGTTVILLSSAPESQWESTLRGVPGIALAFGSHGPRMSTTFEQFEGVPTAWLGLAGLKLGRVALDDQGRVLAQDLIDVRPPFPVPIDTPRSGD